MFSAPSVFSVLSSERSERVVYFLRGFLDMLTYATVSSIQSSPPSHAISENRKLKIFEDFCFLEVGFDSAYNLVEIVGDFEELELFFRDIAAFYRSIFNPLDEP